jgi:RimJ/RimL family protein N-acetyltransferase
LSDATATDATATIPAGPHGAGAPTGGDAWQPVDVALAGGGVVRLRPVVANDRARIVAGFERLSPESRRLRFHEPRQALTSAELDFLSTIDQDRHVSWAACLPDGTGVGIGRYVVDPAPPGARPRAAEIALAVVDAWQRRGIGRALLHRLAMIAAARGLETFHATVLSENRAMRALIERFATSAMPTAGVLRVEIPVAALLPPGPAA